ncbi:MAG: PEGA domain-containing protein [Deltaproteobacteria bacterium]|nr:PEGA domain-containing protein [Deltaproteobacteria bacterium]
MRVLALALVGLFATTAGADPDPKRKIAVVEYRAGSSGLPGIAGRVATALGKQTSLIVSGPDQMRSLYGDTLEQVLVKCAGEAECVAKIGQKAGAVEVILVGVSELGDVILTMQRIDVAKGSVSGRVADSIAAGAQPTDPQLDSYLTRLLPPGDFLRYGVIDIVASEAGASVTVGGENRGVTPIQPLRLRAPAAYEIKVEKQGFVPFTTSVRLPPDGELKVRAPLQRPGKDSWYTRWYVLAGMGLFVAGAAGGAIYLATNEGSDRVTFNGNLR